MISSVCWVPKGAAKTTPIAAEPTEEELEAMKAAALKAQESRGEGDDDSRSAFLTLQSADVYLSQSGVA